MSPDEDDSDELLLVFEPPELPPELVVVVFEPPELPLLDEDDFDPPELPPLELLEDDEEDDPLAMLAALPVSLSRLSLEDLSPELLIAVL